MQQSHVLSAVERQAAGAVVVHHLWDVGEHAAALVQSVAVLFGLGHNDVDASLARPESRGGQGRREDRYDDDPGGFLICVSNEYVDLDVSGSSSKREFVSVPTKSITLHSLALL